MRFRLKKGRRRNAPAMQHGWAPKTEKTRAAMKEERTSVTPYLFVVSIRSSENAIPGRMLNTPSIVRTTIIVTVIRRGQASKPITRTAIVREREGPTPRQHAQVR